MTMSTIILSPGASVTSTSGSEFRRFANEVQTSSDNSILARHQEIHPEAKLSSSGKLPRHIESHRREMMDPVRRMRMERARAELAEEIGESSPKTLAQLRLSKGMLQSQLAAAIGTSQPHIAKIEAGRGQVQWATVTRIADALAVSLDELRPFIEIKNVKSDLKVKGL